MKTTIDYLSFRTRHDHFSIHEALKPVFGSASDLLTLETGCKGRDGWQYSADLMIVDIRVGVIDYGGQSQRDWMRVQMPGSGCEWVQDWEKFEAVGQALGGEIRRLDIALTTFEREVTYQDVLLAHAMGEFKGVNGGVSPNLRTIENSDSMVGNTAYIGLRTSDKMLRCYEKGKESLKDLAGSQRAAITTYEGYPIDDVFRVELELKAKELFIPWTAIGRRDHVLAGAYPFTARLLEGCPEWRMQKLPDFKAQAAITKSLENCRHSYGAIIRAGLEYCGGDKQKLLDLIMASEPSARLVEAGIFTV
jgi:DNA relaxase NicK